MVLINLISGGYIELVSKLFTFSLLLEIISKRVEHSKWFYLLLTRPYQLTFSKLHAIE